MVSIATISNGVDQARLYYISEFKKLRTRLTKGERFCSFGDLICVNRRIKALAYDVQQGLNDEGTQNIYKLLMNSLDGFGASYNIDPNVNIPGTTIIVNVISDGKPAWFDFTWAQMSASGQDTDGGRYVYTNPLLDGWNPSLQTGTTLLYLGVDYDMYKGGIIKFRTGKAIYDSQSIRADNFQPYNAPLQPTQVGTALINNLSSATINYSDNFASTAALLGGQQYSKNPIIDMQQIQVALAVNTKLIFTEYNADGSVNSTITLIRPPSTSFTQSQMSITKRYEFIITDNIV